MGQRERNEHNRQAAKEYASETKGCGALAIGAIAAGAAIGAAPLVVAGAIFGGLSLMSAKDSKRHSDAASKYDDDAFPFESDD